MTIREMPKFPTHIPGFDLIAKGGVPQGRVALVSGTAGSGKTIFAAQFLVEGIRQAGESGVFVSFEESAEDIRRNMAGFGWDIAGWEADNQWAFVDGSFHPEDAAVISGRYDLGGLLARVRAAVDRVGAKRVVLDSFAAILTQFPDEMSIRLELHTLAGALKELGVTSLITGERDLDYGPISRSGMEEFVADSVILLRNVLDRETRRRTVEILKFRGAQHHKGEFAMTILPATGLIVVPLADTELKQPSTDRRTTSGVPVLDDMCGGGFFRDSVILISGATGTGKTLLVTEFLEGGYAQGERCLLFAFEESRDQLGRNAKGWGVDFEAMEKAGRLRVMAQYPEMASAADHLVTMKRVIDEYRPDRVAIDSLSALERVTSGKGFREFMLGLTAFVKDREVTGLFTATTDQLLGGASITDSHISTVTDSIILLRYLERRGEVHRGITVLKMRGSDHDKSIREFSIEGSGMNIGRKLSEVTGILAGQPTELPPGRDGADA